MLSQITIVLRLEIKKMKRLIQRYLINKVKKDICKSRIKMKLKHLEAWFHKLEEITKDLEARTDLKVGLARKAPGFQK
jgi:hypothetical protein